MVLWEEQRHNVQHLTAQMGMTGWDLEMQRARVCMGMARSYSTTIAANQLFLSSYRRYHTSSCYDCV